MTPLVVVGDALLDRDLTGTVSRLSPDAPVPVVDAPVDAPRPGGAGLAALLAAADGRQVTLVTALADDGAGRELLGLLVRAGVTVVAAPMAGQTPEKVRVRADGRSLLRLDRGEAGAVGDLPDEAAVVLGSASAVLVADYGRGVAAHAGLRALLADAVDRHVPVLWDPHPRGPEPVAGCTLVTPNASEAAVFAPGRAGTSLHAVTSRARELCARWGATAVAVTMSGAGALVVSGEGAPSVVPAPDVPCPDPCGAGDRFAATAAGLLADGALASEAVAGAVLSASAFVAAGGAAAVTVACRPPSAARTAVDVVHDVRARGGTVVATGGCFDLLHAGHVGVLEQARALGDCLVVLLNSDESVRRLKGPDRPLQHSGDRARLLGALSCVDAVLVFDEDTPTAALETIRPDVWAKGGDYALADLPESAALARWGGQAVVLPYLPGRSSSALIDLARGELVV